MAVVKSGIFAFLSTIIVFSVLEWASRHWIESYGNALDVTKKVLETDSILGWRQKPNLQTQFLKLPLETNELGFRNRSFQDLPANSRKILILGPSSTFGWGVRAEETYANQLEKILPGFSVINAGEIGFSSDQGRRLMDQDYILGSRPDLVILAYGINDLDRFRFFHQAHTTDRDEFSNLPQKLSKPLFDSSLLTILFKLSVEIRKYYSFPPLQFQGEPVPQIRVSKEQFIENMDNMAKKAERDGSRVLLLTTVMHVPSSNLQTAHCLDSEANKSMTQQWKEKKWEQLRTTVKSILALDPGCNEALYYAAALSIIEKKRAESQDLFERALQSETSRILTGVRDYNRALLQMATERQITVGDLDLWFKSEPLDSLFVDPVHFSARGNQIIAEKIKGLILKNKLIEFLE